jgi:uncharacterized membrane protein YhhN
MLLAAVALAVGVLVAPAGMKLAVAAYSVALGAMAWAAIQSRLHGAVAVGAAMFVLSDMLIFVRLGLEATFWSGYAIWWLYFGGVLLIALGVRAGLDREREFA